MAKKTINLGTPNGKDGDIIRDALKKVNDNFDELYTLTGGTAAELTELAQDYAAAMFTNGTHTGITVIYDDDNNRLNLSVPAGFSGAYADLTGTPTIPVDISDLTDSTGLLSSGTGDITFAATTISAPNEDEIVIQSKDSNGFGTARVTLNSLYGGNARLEAFSNESVDTFILANGDFATGVWQDNGFGNGVVSFTGAQGIGDFFQNTLFKLTPDNVTISINGETPFVWNGGANGSGTDTPGFGTNPIVPATPITITSIEFRYRSESFISVNYDNQEIRLNVQNGGITFDANNTIQMFGDSNIELQSGSDFSISSGQNISIGTSSSDSISLSTGDLNFTAFDDVNFRGSDSFRLRNTSATAPIRIITDDNNTSKTWAFNPNGTITFPDTTIQSTAFTGEADTLDSVTDRGATTTNNITVGSVITTDITNKLSAATGNIVSSVRFWDSAGANLYVWFNAASTPELVTLGNFGSINGWTVSLSNGNSATITATNPAGYFSISTDVALTGSGTLTFTSPDYAPPAPLPIDINVGANTWTFDNSGNLTLPSGGIIRETEVTGNPTIELEPFNALDPSQKLIIKGGYAEEPHLHLTTGNLVETSIFLGTDEHNVRTKVNGGIEITARDYVNAISQTWAFNDSGSLTFPDATVQTTAYPGPITFLNGDVKGSVFADDSTLLVDAVSGSIPYGVLSGAPSFGNFTFNSNTLSTTTGSLDIAVGNKTYSLVNNTEFSLNYLEIPGYIQGGLQTSFLSSNGLGISIDGSNSPNTVDIGNISSSTVLRVKDGVGVGNIVVQSLGTSLKLQTNNNSTWEFNDTTGLTFPDSTVQTTAFTGTANNIASEDAVEIRVNLTDSTTHTWRFGEDGDLAFPDGTTQTTAFAGNAATVDITNTNGIDTNYSITFVENRDGAEILRADVDLTFNSWSNTLTAGNVTTGVLKIDDGVHEKFQTKSNATGTVTHDCSSGHIFYHTLPSANWTVNLTNLNLAVGYATTVTLVIEQGVTGYYPNAIQIDGNGVGLAWQGNTTPTPSSSRIDVVTFSILYDGLYTVLGQLTGF